jgi:hypothetical protein
MILSVICFVLCYIFASFAVFSCCCFRLSFIHLFSVVVLVLGIGFWGLGGSRLGIGRFLAWPWFVVCDFLVVSWVLT